MENKISFKCIKVDQPLGEFYLGSIPYNDLIRITFTDRRRLAGEKDFENYLGIQRPLDLRRVKKISQYIETEDACFPTAVILAIPARCSVFDQNTNTLTLQPYKKESDDDENEEVEFNSIAKILDGQHRIEGLKEATIQKPFEINVSIFIDIDIADQAYLFSTVNLAQTKVNKSLVYDLFDLAKKRSPQKTCHNIAIVLDKHQNSPFFKKIKRLGVATEGRLTETIAQATFVETLMKYITKDAVEDRNTYLKGKKPVLISGNESRNLIFRNMFIQEKDLLITDIIWNYFDAVRRRWNSAWDNQSRGNILNKTNGFKAFMRLLKPLYLNLSNSGEVPSVEDFLSILKNVELRDQDFNIDNFKPGSSGEGKLFRTLLEQCKLETN